MRILTDTERLDALSDYGLCLAQNLHVTISGTDETWVCTWSDKCVIAPTQREAIDLMVAIVELESEIGQVH